MANYKSQPIIIVHNYVPVNRLPSMPPIPPIPHPTVDPFRAKVKILFATLPIKITSGRWVWLKTIYVVTQLREGEHGWYNFRGIYTSEEYTVIKLKGEV